MMEDVNQSVCLSIDAKKFRLRLHKNLYHAIGEPRYIQLLVNPEKMAVAIRAVRHSVPADQSHRIDKAPGTPDPQYEIYSRVFVEQLLGLIPNLDNRFCYRLTGTVSPTKDTAYFSLRTLQKPTRGPTWEMKTCRF